MKFGQFVILEIFLKFYPPNPPAFFVVDLFLWLNVECHIYLCAILLKDIKDLNLLDIFTLVPAAQCVSCIKASNLLKV